MIRQIFHLIIIMLLLQKSAAAQGKFFGGNGDGFASATLSNVVLPLQFTRFTATDLQQEIRFAIGIQYTGSIETILLQRSINGTDFITMDSVSNPVISNTAALTMTDHLPLLVTSFYRVQIRLVGERQVYSTVLRVRQQQTQSLLRAIGRNIYYETTENNDWRLFNTSGQLLKTFSFQKGTGTVETGITSPGIYILKCNGKAPVRLFLH